MIKQFTTYLRETCRVSADAKILLACSGGVDSMVLAELLKTLGQPFALAHCNFQLRENESNLDEKLVADWAKKNEIPCFVKRFETKQIKAETGGSTQMVARELRYTWFRELMTEKDFQCLATAHHLDDSIETFFINLSRGTGLSGLTGIEAAEKAIIRPLGFATKAELLAFAQQINLVWREDASNASDNYLRNRIRHHVVSFFENENVNWKAGMAATLSHLQEAEQALQAYFTLLKQQLGFDAGKIAVAKLLEVKSLGIFLHHCFGSFGFTPSQLQDVEAGLTTTTEKVFLSSSHRLVLSQGYLIVSTHQLVAMDVTFHNFTELETFGRLKCTLLQPKSYEDVLAMAKEMGQKVAFIDYDQLIFPIRITNPEVGDRFHPIGFKGFKLLSDFFTDEKINKIEREQQMILRSNKNDIIWVVGKRLSDQFKVTPSSKRILMLEVV